MTFIKNTDRSIIIQCDHCKTLIGLNSEENLIMRQNAIEEGFDDVNKRFYKNATIVCPNCNKDTIIKVPLNDNDIDTYDIGIEAIKDNLRLRGKR